MSVPVRFRAPSAFLTLVPLAALVLGLSPFDAAAASRRDQAAIDALNQRMQAAETRYRQAMVLIGNGDPTGQGEGNEAVEDMEDVIAACSKQRGCSIPTMLITYKRLLKFNADVEGGIGADLADDDDDADADALAHHVPASANAASLLDDKRHAFDRMVQFNPAVQEGIRRWLTDMRVSLIQSHENYQYMRHLMSPAFERSGLPEALLFGIMAKESTGRVHSGSRAGAVGPLQFMPATGRRFGLGDDGTGFDTRYDPRLSANATASYLNERFGELSSNIELSLAAYNGGEGRALRVYRGSGGRSFWDADVYSQFPPETRDYVPMVIAAAWLYLHPKEYGLTFPRVDTRPATIRLAQPASIYQLTICLGNGGTRDGYMRVLRNLNARHEADARLPAGTMLNVTTKMATLYNRHCVSGSRAELARTLVMSDPNSAIVRTGPVTPYSAPTVTTVATGRPAPVAKQYSVQRGETLTSIARKFQCDTGELAKHNGIAGPRFAIRPGQSLQLEGCARN